MTEIGWGAFFGCCDLTSIEIPDSVKYIGTGAFSGCSRLTRIDVSLDNSNYLSEYGVLYDRNKRKLICVPEVIKGDFVIPSSVTTIEYHAFEGCSGLTSINIPSSVTWIGECAFEGCSGLTTIEIPNSVTKIERCAFSDCSGLTSIEIPNSVTKIGDYAFDNCSGLTSIKIPSSVTSIGERAFKGCRGLREVHCRIKNIKSISIDNDILEGCSLSECTLYVPIGTGYAYRHHPVFSQFKEVVIEK